MNFIGTYTAAVLCSALLISSGIHHTCITSKKTMTESSISLSKTSSQPLQFLYKNKIGIFIRKRIYRGWFNTLAGNYCDSRLSKRHILPFIKKHAITMEESEKSAHEFTTFNDFFTRKLKSHARPIDSDPMGISSPADGAILVMENISTDTTPFVIKETTFNLTDFLGNKTLAQQYEQGTLVVIRLAPYDYHRFHFPLDCQPTAAHRINGIYESVDPLVYAHGVQPLTQNERRLYHLTKTIAQDVLMMSVGALCVGKIKETYTPDVSYAKGEEAGYFLFGGSTIVLIFKPGTITVNDLIMERSKQGLESPIKMGAKFGILKLS